MKDIYNRSELVKTASFLFHTDPENKTRFKIYKILENEGLHPRTQIKAHLSADILDSLELYRNHVNDQNKADLRYKRNKR